MTTATYAPTAPISTTPPQLQPCGIGSELLRTLAPVAGQMFGGLAGHQPFGTQYGSTFGSLASIVPFGAPVVSPLGAPVPSPQHLVQAQLAQQQAQPVQQQVLLQQQAIAQQHAIAHQQAIAHQHAVAQHLLAQQAFAQQLQLYAQPQLSPLMPVQNPYAQFGYWQN